MALEQSSLLDGEVVEHVCAKFHFVDLAGTLVPPTHQADVAGNGGNGGRSQRCLPCAPCRAVRPITAVRAAVDPFAFVPIRFRCANRIRCSTAAHAVPLHCAHHQWLRPLVGGRVDVSILSVRSLSTRRV